jgi:2-keto-3-deoxy-L-rhamnonate aldolase RhmA
MPQIEDMEGINNAEAIMSVEGVGVGFLGPGDLSLSMGLEPGHPDHETAIQKFLAACKKVGKPAGIPTTFEAAQQRIDEGFLMIDVSNELAILSGAARKMVEALH